MTDPLSPETLAEGQRLFERTQEVCHPLEKRSRMETFDFVWLRKYFSALLAEVVERRAEDERLPAKAHELLRELDPSGHGELIEDLEAMVEFYRPRPKVERKEPVSTPVRLVDELTRIKTLEALDAVMNCKAHDESSAHGVEFPWHLWGAAVEKCKTAIELLRPENK